MKLYNLVELTHKDTDVNTISLNTSDIRHRLENLCRKQKKDNEKINGEDNLAKYVVKPVLPKFNSKLAE